MEDRLIPYAATPSFGMARVLVFAPHPDDEVFGCGGALLKQIAEGGIAQVVILTDGDYQIQPADTRAYAQTRLEESRQAAQVLGYGSPEFWGLRDRGLEYGEQLVLRIQEQIRAFAPDGVFAPSVYEMHPDHRALGMAAMEAVRRHGALLKLVMYEVGVPMPRPNVLLDISPFAERKQRAMACFASQLQGQAYDQQIRALNCFRTYTLGTQVTAAEAYLVVQPSELARGSLELYESEYQRQRSMGLPMVPQDVPLVSVIVWSPTGHIPQHALDSIALQTYSHVEVVLLCTSGSSAATTPVSCGRFPLRALCAAGPTSLAAMAHAGMRNAEGEYLIFLHAENSFLPDHLQKLVHAVLAGGAQAACTGVRFVDERGHSIAILDEPWTAAQLKSESFFPPEAVLFSKVLVDKGCHFKETPDPLDYRDFWLQLAALTPFAHAPSVSALCRSASTSLSRPTENQRLQTVLHDTQTQLTKTAALLAASETHGNGLRMQLAALHAQAEQQDVLLALQAARTKSLENTVQALLSSTSWQITRPVRFLSRLLKGRQ